jgi:glycosyltransferase involved in cell wall biosynthesis
MKILMIAPEPFFEPRGTPISVYQRLHALSILGHKVDLLTYHLGLDVSIPGVRIYRVPDVPFIKNVKIGPSWSKLFLDVLLFCKAIAMLVMNQYDVIHSHEEAAFFSVILAAVSRTRHLYDMHSCLPRQLANFSFGNYRPIVKLFKMLERWVINTCDAVITVGADLEEYVREINPEIKLSRIENLAVHTFGATRRHCPAHELIEKLELSNKLPIVYTGTLERYQGLDLLFESAIIVKKHHPEVSFIIVGGNPQQVEYWQNEARKYQLEDSTHFVGTVPPAEALTYLTVAEILVSPRIDGTSVPLKIYSYLHSGKPTVATNLAAHTQVLDEDIALLVAPTREALAEGISKLIRDPDLRKRLGHQAQRFAKTAFDPADYQAKVDRVYQMFATLPYPVKQSGPYSAPCPVKLERG